MAPVHSLAEQDQWLPTLGWFSKGHGLAKSPRLILPGRLAAKFGVAEVSTLRCYLPYDAIGLPGEVAWPYNTPHVAPTFYRLQVYRRGSASGERRPVVCMGDGTSVFFRQPNLVSQPGFDIAVRWDRKDVPCRRAADEVENPCPFSQAEEEGKSPPCTLVCQLHLVVLYPLNDGSGGYGCEAGVYILEVPASKASETLAQLRVLREIGGGHLVGHEFTLQWEQAPGRQFYVPRLALVSLPPAAGEPNQVVSAVQEEQPPQVAEAAEPIPPASGDLGLVVQAQTRLAELLGEGGRVSRARGSSNAGQRQRIAALCAGRGISADDVVPALVGVAVSDLSAAQAAAVIRWGRDLPAEAWAELVEALLARQ